MTRRWIIRGFFIGLLLLFVSFWAASHLWEMWIGDTTYFFHFERGTAQAVHETPLHNEWVLAAARYDQHSARLDAPFDFDYFGFQVWRNNVVGRSAFLIGIPLWLPSMVSAALLWLVWRKTRPNPVGRAFPVEAKGLKTVDEKTP